MKGVEIIAELKYLLNLLTLCWHFSKKPFPLFLEETGYAEADVLLQEPKAGVSNLKLEYFALSFNLLILFPEGHNGVNIC